MFKLIDFQATNVIGLYSGLLKKKVHIDLRPFKDKEVCTIIGENATGKTTFLSLIHPSVWPTDGRQRFILEGKEGSLIRTYQSDDGTVITSTCIYKPKSDGGHTPKCFLSIQYPNEKHSIELNPNGNVSSYNSLLYTYFGITKDYLSFASYSDAVEGIVSMTDTERKQNVSSLIPNTGRFEIAFNTINDKYKELRNLIRNISQKILNIRDEESLNSDLKRISKELSQANIDHEEYIRKLAKAEGRVKELSHGNDLKELVDQYNRMVNGLLEVDSHLSKIRSKLLAIYQTLEIEPIGDGIEFKGIDKVSQEIRKYERKIASSLSKADSTQRRIDALTNELFQNEKEITENESVLYSIQTQDIHELEKTKKEYEDSISKLRYAQNKDRYASMDYNEIVSFMRSVSLLDHMIHAMYDEYGELVSEYFLETQETIDQKSQAIQTLQATIETNSQRRDSLYRAMIEKEQYKKFKGILEQRPSNCHIDTCPFIANALKWQHVADELDELQEQYKQINIEIRDTEDQIKNLTLIGRLYQSAQTIKDYIKPIVPLLHKYLDSTETDLYQSIAHGTWNQILDVLKLKDLAAILSEKDFYNKVTTVLLPDVNHAIEIARVYGSNRDILQLQLSKLQDKHAEIVQELSALKMSKKIAVDMKDHYQYRLSLWKTVDDLINEYREAANFKLTAVTEAQSRKDEIDTIVKLVDKCKEIDKKLDETTEIIHELTPIKQQIELDLKTLMQLKEEKLQIEQDFLIVEVMRMILQPGKGIRKELISIYMYDIYQTANQILLNTFDGKLYLKEFLITDKEFVIPYVYNGSEGSDVAYASSSQQSTIAMVISLAIMSKLIDKYGVIAIDEADRALSPENKAIFVDILTRQLKQIGFNQAFVITHSPEYYSSATDSIGFILFPGAKFHKKGTDYIEVG